MTSDMNVNRAEMMKAAGQIETRSNNINNIQTTLAGQVQDLQGGWRGDAATAFTNAYREVEARFKEVHNELDTLHEKLTKTQKTYTNREAEHAQSTNAIASLLNG